MALASSLSSSEALRTPRTSSCEAEEETAEDPPEDSSESLSARPARALRVLWSAVYLFVCLFVVVVVAC